MTEVNWPRITEPYNHNSVLHSWRGVTHITIDVKWLINNFQGLTILLDAQIASTINASLDESQRNDLFHQCLMRNNSIFLEGKVEQTTDFSKLLGDSSHLLVSKDSTNTISNFTDIGEKCYRVVNDLAEEGRDDWFVFGISCIVIDLVIC